MATATEDRVQLRVNRAATEQAPGEETAGLGPADATAVRAFHATVPGYEPTPLRDRSDLANRSGVARVWVKDESPRFGLGAFKALGVTWAMARILDRAGRGSGTIVTATDGNHGRAVAWAARREGLNAVVYLPEEASGPRVAAIAAEGARAERVPGSYDDAVARAARDASDHGWTLLQDTAWEGYVEIPGWIMQGYLTTLDEALEQAGETPTHVLVQCGVGSFAGAVAGHLARRFGSARPRLVVVEPQGAACGLHALITGADDPPAIPRPPETFMACLSCARLSLLGWRILRRHADVFVACDDAVARRGMRRLAQGGAPVVSGESGAVTAGLLDVLPELDDASLGEALALDAGSRVLLFSTEGATDPEVYASVVGGS